MTRITIRISRPLTKAVIGLFAGHVKNNILTFNPE